MRGSLVGGDHWHVRLTTGRRDAKFRAEYTSPCTANVFLTVQGTKNTVSDLLLSMYQSGVTNGVTSPSTKASKNRTTRPLFSPGQTDEFVVNLGDIGDIVKVRLSHDNTGDYPELLISHMRMTRLPATHASGKSGRPRDGIASSVSSHSLADPNFADLTFFFSSWLSKNIGDGQVIREVASRGSLSLVLQEQQRVRQEALKRPQRNVSVTPSIEASKGVVDEMLQLPGKHFYSLVVRFIPNLWNAGTVGEVMVFLVGQFGDSGPRHLWNWQSAKRRPFQRDQVDDFKIQCVTLGQLSSIKVWLESPLKKTPETWCLEWIQVIEEDASTTSISPSTSVIVRQPPVLFYGDQWLYSEPMANDLQMVPIVLPVDRIFGPNGESDYAFPEKIAKLFALASKPWLHLMVAEDGCLCVGGRLNYQFATNPQFTSIIKSTSESSGPMGFLIRPHLGGFVQLESVLSRDSVEQLSRFRVSPSDGSVCIDETANHEETLLMPFVKVFYATAYLHSQLLKLL
ncbi:unnamed protein product [Hydatigera taeniaeformis]|uniref:PLAT domain-containing protein n=1 Tax=Hydatigena taeniaeformis TaxID=6205 RepID=A0A0R3X9I4_HYDTA|nr:unnamed protein product [Hydatigera taeniaeformis]